MRLQDEQGAILISTLLLVAVISTLAVAMIGDVRANIQRSGHQSTAAQGRYFVLGTEEYARQFIHAVWSANPGRTEPRWLFGDGTAHLSFEEGSMDMVLSDAGACFNLNSLVAMDERMNYRANAATVEQFERLLGYLAYSPYDARRLTAALVDWMDSDNAARDAGAEDSYYQIQTPAYRTGGTLLADISELRAIRGFDARTIDALAPFVCALPTSEGVGLNINALAPYQAPLLAAILDGKIGLETAIGVIARRPDRGFTNLTQLWQDPVVSQAGLTGTERARLSLRTRFYRLETRVQYAGEEFWATSLMELDVSGSVALRSRKLGDRR